MEKTTTREPVWTKEQDEEQRKRFYDEPLKDIAKSMGISYKKASYHARRLGLYKIHRTGFCSRARRIIAESFHNHSVTELARLTGVSKSTVGNIIKELGLKRTPEEKRAISSRVRRELLESERIRINWGIPQKTKLPVYTNRKKRQLHYFMRRLGYIDGEDGCTLYYDEDTTRRPIREEHGLKLGLRFEPLPDDWFCDDDEEDEDGDEDKDSERDNADNLSA